MSMNLEIFFTIPPLTEVKFDSYQTSSRISYQIVTSDNPIEAYKTYIKSLPNTQEHLEEFNQFIDYAKSQGYLISVELI